MRNELIARSVGGAEPEHSPSHNDPLLLYLTNELHAVLAPLQRSVAFMLQRAHSLPTDEALLAQLEVLLRQVERAQTLVERQDAFAWLYQGNAPLALQRVDLAQLAGEVVSDFALGMPELSLAVEAPEPVWLLADPLHLGQVLWTLIGSAVRTSAPGNLITARVWQEQERAYCAISDDLPSVGADEPDQPPLWRLRDLAERTARVGLAISATIVRRYGGLLLQAQGRHSHEVRWWVPLDGPQE
jgi:signal transduction histidine kinase